MLLLLISIQFASPYLPDPIKLTRQAVQSTHDPSAGLSFLFEETRSEREGEDDRTISSYVLVDFTCILRQRYNNARPVITSRSPEHHYNVRPPLFKVYHTFLI